MKTCIWKYSDVKILRKELEGKKVVLAGGCFDILHYGHFTFLQQAKNEGDVLVIALESDEFILKSKKRNPIHTQKQRADILAALHMVDHVILLPLLKSDKEYEQLVTSVHPNVIAVTSGDANIKHKEEHAKLINAEVKVVSSLLSEFSTTQIIANENISRS